MKKGLRASWFPRVGWEGLGNAKMKHEKGFGCFMAPKMGREGFAKAKNKGMKRGWGVSHSSQE